MIPSRFFDLMSADMGSMQAFHPQRGELWLLAEKGFNPGSAAHWEWVRPDFSISGHMTRHPADNAMPQGEAYVGGLRRFFVPWTAKWFGDKFGQHNKIIREEHELLMLKVTEKELTITYDL